MAIISFRIPAKINRAFQEMFAPEDRDAVMIRLIQQAIEEKRREQRRATAIDDLLELRRRQRPVSDAEIIRARMKDRP